MASLNSNGSPFNEDPLPGGNGRVDANSFGFSKLTPSDGAFRSAPKAAIPSGVMPKRRKPVERKFNISELIKVMYRGRWIILATFIAAFAYTVYSTYSKPYIYGSSARMFRTSHREVPRSPRSLVLPHPRTIRSRTKC